jgi:hypothetical protein
MERVGRKSRSDVIVCLISPPAYYPWSIPPGVAYLAGYLVEHGVGVRIVDANVEALEHVLTQGSSDRARTSAALASLRDAATLHDWRRYGTSMTYLSAVAKGLESQLGERLTFERNTLRYYPAFERRSRKGLIAAVLNAERHLFAQYYSDVLAPRLARERPDVIGISASDLHQLLPATVMAAVIRRSLGDGCPPIIFGGNVFSRLHDVLRWDDNDNRQLFALWGTVIVGEGERPLMEFVNNVCASRARDVDGQLVLSRAPQKAPPINLDLLPTPKCDGFKTFSPELPIPLNVYRGCHFSGICQFCDINQGYDSVWTAPIRPLPQSVHRRRSLDKVIADIRTSMFRYGTTLFNFTDEWFPARDMLELADRLLSDDLRIQWDAYARFEPALADPENAQKLSNAGLRFLQFGLETASASTLQLVKKGITPDLSARVLKTTAAAGIWNHVFVIVGLPGEALHDTLFTIHFLKQHADHIFTIKPTRFRLSRWSPLARQPSHLVSVDIALASERELALDLPFHYGRGNNSLEGRMLETSRRCEDVQLSHRGVNAMYAALEVLASEHWAYGFTSLYPYHTRMLFTSSQARAIAHSRAKMRDRKTCLWSGDAREAFLAVGRYLRLEAKRLSRIQRIYAEARLDSAPVDGDPRSLWRFADSWCNGSTALLRDRQPKGKEQKHFEHELVLIRR